MYENMSGPVGFAMHEDRLAQGARNLRVSEAERATNGQRARDRRSIRDAIARTLMTVAERLAPTVATEKVATAR